MRHKGPLYYKDLFMIFAWRDFNVKYRQAVFGVAWALIQPISFTALFALIYSFAIPIKMSSVALPVYLYSGLFLWFFFSSSVTYAIQSLTSQNHLLSKIYFPRVILLFSGMVTGVVDLFVSTTLFVIMLVFYQIELSLQALWCFPLLFLLILLTSSMALVLSILNVYYRDVSLVSAFLIQVLFFSTPIFYSLDAVPGSVRSY